MKSILQTKEECYFCHYQGNLETHHCVHGTANRKIADRLGLTVRLCGKCHKMVHDKSRDMDLKLIKLAQRKYEETHSREEWMQLFAKNWLWDEE